MSFDFALAEVCVRKQIDGLCNVLSVINTQRYKILLEELWETIELGGRIFMCGVGKNANIATKISESMASLGVPSSYISATNYLHGDAGFINDNDIVVYISRSGTTDEIIAMSKHLTKNRPQIMQWMIHANPNANLKDLEDIGELFVPHIKEGDRNELAPTTSTTAFLCLLDSITVLLSDRLGFTKEQFLAFHPGGNLGKILREEIND